MKLSVVIPFYRAAPFVPAAMGGLARQARPDTEFVLVEDCSGDDTLNTLHRWSERVPGARVVERASNGGLAAARNTGIEASAGRYVTFLDADDWYGPGYLDALVAAIERLPCDFVRVDHVQVRDRKRWIVRSPEGRRDDVFAPRDSILPSDRSSGVDYPYAWAGIFDVERLGKELLRFDDGLHTCEDRPWLWRLYLGASSHAVTGLAGLFYRRDVEGSLTQIGDERQLHFLDAFALIFRTLDATPDADPMYRHKAIRSFCAIIAHHLRLESRFTPALRATLRERSAAALRQIDRAELDRVFSAMADARAARLRQLLRRHAA